MLAFVFAPFFFAVEALIFYRTVKHIQKYKIKGKTVIPYVFAAFLLSGAVAVLAGFFVESGNPLKRPFTRFGYYWFGYFLYFCVGLIISLIVRYIVWVIKENGYSRFKARQHTIAFVILFTATMSVYGTINAHNLKISNYEIDVDKKCELTSLNVALIADLHIGYNIGQKEVGDMVDKVNSMDADIVIIAGDIFDNEYAAIEEPDKIADLLKGLKSRYGTYAVYGNHDIDEKILMGFTFRHGNDNPSISDDMQKLLEDADIQVLYDDFIEIEGIQLYGRPDSHKINLGNITRSGVDEIVEKLDLNRPVIVIDHEPGELEELAEAGVDVDLSGHTHGGQLWPLKYINNLIWENPYGYLNVDGMHSIVTSGAGLFGPNLRTFTNAEICSIKINFKG